MIKRRFGLVAGATAALAIGGGTHAFADAAAAQASTPDMRAELSIPGPPGSSALSRVLGSVSSTASDPTTAMATLTSDPVSTVTGLVGDPISTINGLLGTVAGAGPTGLVSGVIQDLAGNPVSTVTGIVSNPTGAVSSLLSNPTDAVSGVLNTVSQADSTGVAGNVVNTVTSGLPAVGDLTSTVSKTLNSVTGTVNGLPGSATSSRPPSAPSISSINR
jgi:phage-related protein